ncbi:hypothetical protein U9M48_009812 [Paspalum notatum var. saurae]|uniref:Uncharacterized protein n=1 Tax=Paspalum notatum var. saurae TaxID=547442 RepID=A0AAQ3STC8_PASNO
MGKLSQGHGCSLQLSPPHRVSAEPPISCATIDDISWCHYEYKQQRHTVSCSITASRLIFPMIHRIHLLRLNATQFPPSVFRIFFGGHQMA